LVDWLAMASSNDISSTAVERTLLILEAAAQREGGMSNADFSRKLKIPKSSASYILRTWSSTAICGATAMDGRYRWE
jgi:DNA-binding IclR family transcriptional regulator